MAEEHATNWLGHGVQEFGKLPPMGKAAVVGLVGGVVFLGYRHWAASKATVGLAPDQSTPADAGSTAGSNYPANGPTSTGTVGTPGPPGPPGPPGAPGAPFIPPRPILGGPLPPPPPAPKPAPPPRPQLQYYTVVHGDSLSAIAAKLHLRGGWQALYNQNKNVVGGNPNLIFPGQRLNITGLR